MKKLTLFALLLIAALLSARLVHDMTASAQGGAATDNGDVNGDGTRDLSDAIHLLGWLFLGGPAPVALADSPQLEMRVTELEKAVAGIQTSQPAVAAAVDSLALLLGDAGIANAVPTGALQPLDGARPFTLLLNGVAFGEVVGVHIIEEVSSLPVAHVAVRIVASVMETDPLLGTAARLDFQEQDRLTHFTGEVVAAGLAGREGRNGIIRLSIAPQLHRLTRTHRSQVLQGVRYSDVVSRIFGEHRIQVPGPFGSVRHDAVFQYNETDFDFFSRLLEEEGFYYFVEHGPQKELVRITADSRAAPLAPGVFQYRGHQGNPVVPGEAYVRTIHAAGLQAPATLQVSGWNYLRKDLITSTYPTGQSGGLQDFFIGERNLIEQVDLEARVRRDRALVDRQAVAVTSTIPFARPGYVVTIGGVEGAFEGKYFVTGARHTGVMVGRGAGAVFHYGNAFRALPADVLFRPEPRTPRPRIEGVQTAVVSNNQDPDRLGRVKVEFPWLNNGSGTVESDWIRLAQPGAGKERGVFWLPEVSDEVVVSFVHGDPQHPVVIGALWNGKDAPPEEPTARNDRRVFKSRSGHQLLFDDTDGAEKIAISSKMGLTGISLEASSTQVSGVLASSRDAGPGLAVLPGDRHRDNSIVAWARVSASGDLTGTASLGVRAARRVRVGWYRITLNGSARSPSELIPVAVAEVPRQPATPVDLRLVSVNQVDAANFDVYINSGEFLPTDSDLVFMVTAR